MARRTSTVTRHKSQPAPNVVPIDPTARAAARRHAPPGRTAATLGVENAKAIAMLMQGQSIQSVADSLGIHRRTLERRLQKPEAQAMIVAAEQEALSAARRTLLTHAGRGVATLALAASGRIQHPDGSVEVVPWAQRVSAASRLVELALGRTLVLAEATDPGAVAASARLADRVARIKESLAVAEVAEESKPKRAPRRKTS